ncbi:MAG: methyltransferase domain-containing protein [Myxococcota bacterium]
MAAPGPDAAPPTPDPPGTYMGRTIAATMSHLGAPWLVRPEREREENTRALIRALRLQPGDTACDLGAGNGYHALRMAAAVGATGRVIASDLQPEMLEALRARATAAGVLVVDTVLATERNPKLPAGACDVVLMVDVYHELSDPAAVLARIRPSLSPRGHIALVEFRAEDPAVPIKPLHKMSKAQILREYEANDYRLTRAFDALPWQHLMFFAPNGRASEDDNLNSGAGTR